MDLYGCFWFRFPRFSWCGWTLEHFETWFPQKKGFILLLKHAKIRECTREVLPPPKVTNKRNLYINQWVEVGKIQTSKPPSFWGLHLWTNISFLLASRNPFFFSTKETSLLSKGRPSSSIIFVRVNFKLLVVFLFSSDPKTWKKHTKWFIGVNILRPACLLECWFVFYQSLWLHHKLQSLWGSVSPPQERCSIPGVDESIWETWVAWKFLALEVRFFPPGCGLRFIDMAFLGEFGDPKLSHFSHDCILGICDLHHASSRKGAVSFISLVDGFHLYLN